MQKKKKGFTLVELLVVIAILAILASVSVVGYLSFTKKAQESNDVSLTDQMNTVLQANEALDKADTLGEAIKQIKEDGGVDLELITPNSKGYNYAWDKKQNRILLLNESNEVVAPANLKDEATEDTVIIVKTKEQLEKAVNANYGIGIASSYAEDITTYNLFKEVSLDNYAGKIKTLNVKSTAPATYSLERNTNSNVYYSGIFENITLDESNGVTVYGKATTLDVKKNTGITIAANINKVVVSEGNVNVVEKAVVDFVDASKASNSSKVTINKTATAVVGGVQAPEGNKGAVDGNIGSDIVVDSTPVTDFAGGLGTETSPYLISNANEFNNINNLYLNSNEAYHFKQINDLVVKDKILKISGSYNGGNYTLSLDKEVSVSIKGTYFFEKIVGHMSFKNINVLLEGRLVSLLCEADWNTNYGTDFINITLNSDGKNISVNNNNCGLLVLNALYTTSTDGKPAQYNFINCINNVNYENTGTCTGIFIGSGPCFNSKATTLFENCINNGNVTGNSSVGMLYGNGAYVDSFADEQIIVKNCKNNGVLLSFADNAVVNLCPNKKGLNDKYQAEVGGLFVNDNYLKDKTIKLNQSGSTFTINTNDNSVTYKMAINVQSIVWPNGEVSNGIKFFTSLEINTAATGKLNSIHAYDKETAISMGIIKSSDNLVYTSFDSWFDATIVTKEDKNYLIIDAPDGYKIDSSAQILVYSFENGRATGVKTILNK